MVSQLTYFFPACNPTSSVLRQEFEILDICLLCNKIRTLATSSCMCMHVQQLCVRLFFFFFLYSQNYGLAITVKIIRTDCPKLDSYSYCFFGNVIPIPQKQPTFCSWLLNISIGVDVSQVQWPPKHLQQCIDECCC